MPISSGRRAGAFARAVTFERFVAASRTRTATVRDDDAATDLAALATV